MSHNMLPKKVNTFPDQISTIVAAEIAYAIDSGSDERAGDAIESQTRALALSIVVSSRGNPQLIGDLLENCTQVLFEEAARLVQAAEELTFHKPSTSYPHTRESQ